MTFFRAFLLTLLPFPSSYFFLSRLSFSSPFLALAISLAVSSFLNFFPVCYVSLDFLSCRFSRSRTRSVAATFSLIPFPYFILASSREKLCTSPLHFSCPLCWTQLRASSTLSCNRRRRPLGSFSLVSREGYVSRCKLCPKTTRLSLRGIFAHVCDV